MKKILPGIILLVLFLGCSGAGNNFPIHDNSHITDYGIEFFHNEFYTTDELNEAAHTVDVYFEMAQECAKSIYPDMTDAIYSLPAEDMQIVVQFPDKYNPQTGQEAFSCKFSKKGCAGIYYIGGTIDITPSLDALGHEMSHWINFMLFGETSDDNPSDLSQVCKFSSICHLYSQNRNLIACR
ncbi:MAG: hypothetical protein Q8O83_01725 [bacterium]|nr:hypothetical protein [bacterium]